MSEICAFHPSTGNGARYDSSNPSGPFATSCSGSCRLTPPRRTSRCWRRMPTSRRSRSTSSADPSSRARWTPPYVELLPAADTSLANVDVGALAGLVDVHRPDERGTQLAGKQARRALGQLGRVQARVAVGRVERHTAPVRLLVERAAGRDEGRDVGDRVPHSIPGAATFDVQRLVEVLRLRWVDRDELDRRLVRLRQLERRDRPLRVVDDLLRKRDGDLQLASQLGERRLDLDGVGSGQAQALPRHQESLDSARMGACPACGTDERGDREILLGVRCCAGRRVSRSAA